ncbi:Ubiquinone biosynthesis protein coq9- mitochondrial [Apiospora marii]|uniref:Ubiquinone biosynthesis protein coq9- mitochondrial n=1 Tax=Apiospora marii TaxID=335849 RepID=UPI00312EBDCA
MAPTRALVTRLASAATTTTTKSSRPPPFAATATACLRDSSSDRRRTYHSYDHPPPPGAFNNAERQILSAAYRHVPEHGFTHKALSLGARDAGYLDISTNVVPEGPFSLIKYHLVSKREALAPRSAEIFNAPVDCVDGVTPDVAAGARGQLLTVPERVERLTWERLLANQDIIHRWQEALAVMAQPSRVPASLHELASLSDEIYHLAGDLAVDPSWYTKRASLSTIYASSELFMTNDQSAGFGDTRAFLRRRLDETGSLAGALGSIGQWVGFTASAGLNVLRSKGARI